MIRWILASVLTVHGLIHLMGFAKSSGYAELPQLTLQTSRPVGLLWLCASLLVFGSALGVAGAWRHTWMVGAVALTLSQALIVLAWRDAWAGTVVNGLLLIVVLVGWFTDGPGSFQSVFERDVADGLRRPIDDVVVTEADLEPLPPPVRRYLRLTGAVGRPRVRNYRLHFTGRIRSAPDAAWMPFKATQHSFVDRPTRLFLMRARMSGVPVMVYHQLVGGHATMQVKVVGAIPMADARGEEMDRSETVTLFNDMCVLAPATLIGPGITWEAVDDNTSRARFTHGAHTIAATLVFGNDGVLVNFISDDRSKASPDGKVFTRLQFSTPLRDYQNFGSVRLAAHGEARWLLPEGEFTYGEFLLQDIAYNVRP
jgi:hypothetical protein